MFVPLYPSTLRNEVSEDQNCNKTTVGKRNALGTVHSDWSIRRLSLDGFYVIQITIKLVHQNSLNEMKFPYKNPY